MMKQISPRLIVPDSTASNKTSGIEAAIQLPQVAKLPKTWSSFTLYKFDKIEIFIKEIRGINYYLDNKNNVYKAEDIISNKLDPDVIAHYLIMPDGSYTIPQFNKTWNR